ncbi:histidinol-phosphate transaminase [Desulfolucanica intricata]|uniref:histidinol-phosphate transaminase n=1 Tax=Desulfolucanica intricata TaxID=1285191 RepID=UPI0008312BEB|nr:histidinol-phosphate transaminase [Desulfolucanica intricata]
MKNFAIEKLVRKDLSQLTPYEPEVHPGVVKLDANENPFDMPEEVLRAINLKLNTGVFTRYPDPLAAELRQKLSGYTGVKPEEILVGSGSDELILNIIQILGPGAPIAVVTPTFSMYWVHSLVVGAKPLAVPRRQDFSVDIEELIRVTENQNCKAVFLCSPNNPTGNTTPPEDLAELLKRVNALVIVDEAYIEFGGETAVPLLQEYANLVILRTFSKAFGLAGLRTGYLLAAKEVVGQLLKVQQPFNLNNYSQIAAAAVMEHLPLFQSRINLIIEEREILFNELKKIPEVSAVYPSLANYIMFKTQKPADRVFKELLEKKILIRNLNSPQLPECLRISVGTPEENKLFLKGLREVLS